jgi:hypothetical protein
MLVLFWLPILLSESCFDLAPVRLLTCYCSCICMGSLSVCSNGRTRDGTHRQGAPSSSQPVIAASIHGVPLSPIFILFVHPNFFFSCVILSCYGLSGMNTPESGTLNMYAL